MEKTIGGLVREFLDNDRESVNTSKYVFFNMRETLERIDAYLNSKHIRGDVDSKNREKPFFNIVKAAVNIWYRATDIDRKNIRIQSEKDEDATLAFAATVLLKRWMRKTRFGRFLNSWGRSLCRYCSSIVKFIEKDGKLFPEVKSWSKMFVDSVDFDNNLKIEKLELLPAQLRKRKEYNQELVKKLLDALETRKTAEGQSKDSKDDYITLYEVHGELPLSLLTNKESDEDDYVQQMHVITFLENKETNEFDDYTLYAGKEAKEPNMLTHLIEEEDRTLGVGAVEDLFDVQWMLNHNAKIVKDQLDLASKMLFQTSDGKFIGQNVLTAVEQGDIFIHSQNQPLTQLNNEARTAAIENNTAQWKRLGNELVGISEAMLGEAPKSGTAWRQTRAILQENHSLFELMRENKAEYLETMLTEYVIPFIKKQMDTSEEISAVLDDYDIKWLDARYVPNEARRRVNQKIKNEVLSGRMFYKEDQDLALSEETAKLEDYLKSRGNQRFFKPSDIKTKTWKEALKDFEWNVVVDITGEQQDTEAMLTTLTEALRFIAQASQNPAVLENPKVQLLFNRILTLAGGISPLELSAVGSQPTQQPIQRPAALPAPAAAGPAQAGMVGSPAGVRPTAGVPAGLPVTTV